MCELSEEGMEGVRGEVSIPKEPTKREPNR
jgi:hypothetical protein